MRRLLPSTLALSLAASSVLAQPQAAAERWWSHVQVLADDGMEGRLTGTPGYQRAADYVAGRFKAYGLQPAGAQGYFQTVAFKQQRVFAARSSAALVQDGRATPLAIGPQLILGNRTPQPKTVEAPLVFIGYGLHLPEEGYDDFAGGDLRGKIVVYINGGPSTLSSALKAHARAAAFGPALERAGVAGAIAIANPKSMDIPWARQALSASQPGMLLADPSLRDVKGAHFTASLNPAEAQALFVRSGRSFAEMLALADASKPLPRFDLKQSLRAQVATEVTDVSAPNVVAVLPGSDPKLKAETLVLSAHLDHLGVGEPVKGDRINNGAMDNASGIASLLEVARAMTAPGAPKPKRSIVFLAVCAEEKGLLGSRFHANRPTRTPVVADINMDMFLPLWPLKALTVYGEAESSLGVDARAVAQAQGLAMLPDPEPDRNAFTRSDQYSFIRAGVPSVAMKFGYALNTPEARIQKAWLTERYHAPQDDLNQPVDREAAVKFNSYLIALIRRVAENPTRPSWNKDSFFRRFEARGTGGSAQSPAQPGG